LGPVHERALSSGNLSQSPISGPWNLQYVKNPRWHLSFRANCIPHMRNAPNLRTQTRFRAEGRLTDSHIDKSLRGGPNHPPPKQFLTERPRATARPLTDPVSPRPQAVRRPNNTPAATTDTTTIPTLHATAVTAADPGACPASSARSESITAVTG
jgi:hypothetical protein